MCLGIATAVVINGAYEEDIDRGSTLIYVGEGKVHGLNDQVVCFY